MTSTNGFENFVRSYQNMVYTTAVRILGNETDAQDIAQEVFLRAFKHYESISGSETAGGWLKTVTRNLCINHITRYRNRWTTFTDQFSKCGNEGDDGEIVLPEDETSNVDLDNLDRSEILSNALETLPEKQRVPLVLYHFENLSYDEISSQMKVSLSKIKTDISRGRQALKKVLSRTMEDTHEFNA
ncbi:MAG: RNA polymerase sigma factor [Verrucomicrobia bacterium]|nr:RNA polymerase sigma factor [Verrucomicrobiota bacterium]